MDRGKLLCAHCNTPLESKEYEELISMEFLYFCDGNCANFYFWEHDLSICDSCSDYFFPGDLRHTPFGTKEVCDDCWEDSCFEELEEELENQEEEI